MGLIIFILGYISTSRGLRVANRLIKLQDNDRCGIMLMTDHDAVKDCERDLKGSLIPNQNAYFVQKVHPSPSTRNCAEARAVVVPLNSPVDVYLCISGASGRCYVQK